MGSKTELRINLGALKRQDPYIETITDSSTHVAVYSFSPQLNEWEKTDVEGTLFVYRRVAPPYWGFTILNRLSMDNLTEPLTAELEFQTQNPFLLYRNAKLLIYGIWFYDQDDCKRIGELLEKLCVDSTKPMPDNVNAQRVNFFVGSDNIAHNKDSIQKCGSPTSNSVNSISPGSSVGAAPRPLSNGEADSESDDKEVSQNNRGSFDILDLLSKAQDKYEKEKRSTPETIMSPTEAEQSLVKPVPVKPTHPQSIPQKLDVASLFKMQPPKPVDVNLAVTSNTQLRAVPTNTTPLLPTPTMNNPYAGIMTQPIPTATASVPIPQQNNMPRQIGRSFSMTEMPMRKRIDPYLNGNVMSVEEIEAGIGNRNPMATSRQQQVNSTLDRMIDQINSSGVLTVSGPGVRPPQTQGLPGIQEATLVSAAVNPFTGNSGSMVVNGNKALYGDGEVFVLENSVNLYEGALVRAPLQTFMKPLNGTRQRSISSSSIQQNKPVHVVTSKAPGGLANPNFPTVPTLPLHAVTQQGVTTISSTGLPTMHQSNQLQRPAPHLLFHGNASIANNSTPLISSMTTAVASVVNNAQVPKALSHPSNSSPALPTTLISPEDFERSAGTPQKKLELKQRLLQDVRQPQQSNITPITAAQIPLNKEQLRQTLVYLLQKDGAFLDTIHETYMANFKQT